MASEFDVAVVGAGAAGIAAGRRLVEGGASTLILEARQRLGGRAWTVPSAGGQPLDLGCEWLHSADRNPWTDIAISLGFAIDERLPDWRSRLARRYGDATQADWEAARAAYERRCIAAAERGEDMPAASLLEPGGGWNGLLDAVSTWANGVELERLSVLDHARYSDSGINWRLFAGYGTLIAAHAAGLPIRLGTDVRAIDHGGRSRLRLVTDAGDVAARAVIVTVPSNVLAAEAIRFAPALPGKLAAAAGLPLGVANKLFLKLEERGDAFPRDHHMLGHRDRTATGAYLIRPHEWPIVSGYFGGRLATELEQAGPEAMTQFALDELAGIFGESIRPRLSFLASSAWVGDRFARGSYSYALPGHAGDRAILAAPVEDRLFFAGEACSAHDFSTAHGAYRTGRAAAEAALAALKRQGTA
ncbi:MAG TPA: NAD(P)/FAD-dependent oxidoreductase [Stellaceae bacterium]|nr:NAD(P)/FAD-dependent oxidoreductase [Stellaceae bacterium]